jgi:hypothetical protein
MYFDRFQSLQTNTLEAIQISASNRPSNTYSIPGKPFPEQYIFVRFYILTAASMKFGVFWEVAPT